MTLETRRRGFILVLAVYSIFKYNFNKFKVAKTSSIVWLKNILMVLVGH